MSSIRFSACGGSAFLKERKNRHQYTDCTTVADTGQPGAATVVVAAAFHTME